MFIIGQAGLSSRRHHVGLCESHSALDAQIVFERPYIAHSSLPIYGSDTHLRICSKAEILAAEPYKNTRQPNASPSFLLAKYKSSMKTSVAVEEHRLTDIRLALRGFTARNLRGLFSN